MLAQISPTKLGKLCSGKWLNRPALPMSFTSVQIDSRLMQQKELFIALKGSQLDGHQFIECLSRNKNQAAVVERPTSDVEVAQLCVADSLQALHSLAKEISAQSRALKFAVTGSLGKTGTKDMLCHMLSGFGRTHATKGNYNNHIGTPLTLAQMPEGTQFLICELGMNKAGEIADLTQMVRPSVAAITCIADSHIGHFDSLQKIADAKAELFCGLDSDGIAILPRDDRFYTHLATATKVAGATRIVSFGRHAQSNLRLVDCTKDPAGLLITLEYPQNDKTAKRKTIHFRLAMSARHWAENALCALAMCHAAGLDLEAAAARLAEFGDLSGRGKTHKVLISGRKLTLIDDSYNAAPASMKAALAALGEASGTKTAILSDMLELGRAGADAHIKLARQISDAGVHRLLTIGPLMQTMSAHLASEIEHVNFKTSTQALEAIDQNLEWLTNKTDIMLIKGSHGSGSHLISAHLIQTYGSTNTDTFPQGVAHVS